MPLHRLILDFLSDQFQFDARIWRTLHLLLLRPGHLTRNYLAGQRQRYIPPIRLYLFVTIVFFLTVGLLPVTGVHVNFGTPADLHVLAPGLATKPVGAPASTGSSASPSSATDIGALIQQRIAGSGRARSPAAASTVRVANTWIVSRLAAYKKTPGQFWKRFWSNMPKVLFFLIPVFALLLKLLYLLRKRYYSEHLIFTLHYHSALFLYLLAVVLLMLLARVLGPVWASVVRWTCLALAIWAVVYVVPAMRITYADSWPRVVPRGLMLWFAYAIALFTGTITAMTIAFAMS